MCVCVWGGGEEGGLPVELQWHVCQNRIALGFLKMTFYSLGKVTSLLREKSVFSVIASKSLKSSLFDICGTRLKLKAWPPYKSEGLQPHVCEQVF